jgi:hypothetical protein
VGQESGDFRCPKRRRVALAIEEDEAPHPVELRCLCAQSVVLEKQRIASMVKKFFWGAWGMRASLGIVLSETQVYTGKVSPIHAGKCRF